MSVLTTFIENNIKHINGVAIETNGKFYTRQMLGDDAIKFAGILLKSGLKAGDKIAIVAQNCYEGIVATFGASAIGIKVAILKPLDESEIKPFYDELEAHRPKMVIFDYNSAAWMSAVKSYANYIKIYLAANPIDNYTRQYFSFRSALNGSEISFEGTMEEIEKHKSANDSEPMFFLGTSSFSNHVLLTELTHVEKTNEKVLCQTLYCYDFGFVSIFSNILRGNQIILVNTAPKNNYYEKIS